MKCFVWMMGVIGTTALLLGIYATSLTTAGDNFLEEYSYWAKTYGGGDYDEAHAVQQTVDDGYIVGGYTVSFGAGGYDYWIIKLNSTGDIEWQKTYGGSGDDYALSLQQAIDGGYIVAGYTNSFGAGNNDVWVIKLNSTGGIEWQKTYGGSGDDGAYEIQQTADKGYVLVGYTSSFGVGSYDIWVIKLNSTGDIEWEKTYGGNYGEWGYSIQQTTDGGYIVAGFTDTFGAGQGDIWIIKLNSTGGIEWEKTYGGTDEDRVYTILQTTDGGYIVAGSMSILAWSDEIWIIKLNSTGGIEWQKRCNTLWSDYAFSIWETNDGGYIVASVTYSFGAGGGDYWIIKLNSAGSIEWQKTYGGTDNDYPYSIQQTADGGYIVAGYGEWFGAGRSDFWVIKLNQNGSIVFDSGSGVYTNDTSITLKDTSATVTNTSITGQDSDAVVNYTNASVQDTNAIVYQQAPPLTMEFSVLLIIAVYICTLSLGIYRKYLEKT